MSFTRTIALASLPALALALACDPGRLGPDPAAGGNGSATSASSNASATSASGGAPSGATSTGSEVTSSGAGTSSAASTGAGEPPPPALCASDVEAAFTLPPDFGNDQLDDLAKDSGSICAVGELSYATLDIDGDLAPDLVVTDQCDSAGVGTDRWLVYLNVGTGFAATPIEWTLPGGFATDQLDDTAKDSASICGVGELSYATLDMNGDHQPDLVVTDRCDGAGIGTNKWEVFVNTGSAFAATPIDWTLPSGFGADQLDDVAKDSAGVCVQGELAYRTLDMNGDEQPDLVVTDRCDLAGVGSDHWEVHLGTGTGFSNTAIAWPLPTGFATDQLDDVAKDSGASCVEGELSYATIDMDADLRPDLVVTDRCDHAGVGTERWQIFRNEGGGFASAPADWPLPAGFATDQLDDVAKNDGGTCLESELSYELVDADGDRRPDLLVADRCDHRGVGTTHWLLYPSGGSGFVDPVGAWTLPGDSGGFGVESLDDVAKDTGGLCAVGELSYGAIDLDGDRVLDLVITDGCDHLGVGTTHWRVFRGVCAP